MRHLTSALAVAMTASLVAAAPAGALPQVTSTEITGTPATGLTISVTAKDPDAAVNAVRVDYGSGEGGFGESACRIGRNGEPQAAGSLGPGRSVRFDVPFEPELSGPHQVAITVVSGACGDQEHTTSVTVPLDVSAPGLPTTPDPAKPPLLPLPPLPGLPPLPVVATAAADCADTDVEPTATNLKVVRAATLCLVNAERAARGLHGLRQSTSLQRAATRHSKDMVARHFFNHEGPHGPDLVARLRKVRFWPATASENLGAGQGVFASADTMVDAWMHSSAHRTNILTARFRQVGFGIVAGTPQGGDGATYTADFGRR